MYLCSKERSKTIHLLFYLGGLIMGKKIPMWQCLIVMVVLIALIFWGVMIDTDAGEAHVSLIFAGAFAAIVAMLNGWKWNYMEQGILASINSTMHAIIFPVVVGVMLATWIED